MNPASAPERAGLASQLQRRRLLCAALGAGAGLAATPLQAQPTERLQVPIGLGSKGARPFVGKLLDLIAQAANIEWQPQLAPFARQVLMAERGQCLAFGLSRSEPRELVFEFSEPLFVNHAWIVVRRDKVFNYRGVEDLRDRVLCLPRGVVMGPELEAARGSVIQVKQTDVDIAARVRMVVAGRCDLLLATYRSARPESLARMLGLPPGGASELTYLPKPIEVSPVYLAAARGSDLAQRALPRINTALRQQAKAIEALANSDI